MGIRFGCNTVKHKNDKRKLPERKIIGSCDFNNISNMRRCQKNLI